MLKHAQWGTVILLVTCCAIRADAQNPNSWSQLLGVDPPGAPRNVLSSVAGRAVTVTWDAPATGGAPTTYVIEAGSAAGLSDVAILTTVAPRFAGFAPSGTYFVRVRATNAAGVGPASDEIVVPVGRCLHAGSPHATPSAPV